MADIFKKACRERERERVGICCIGAQTKIVISIYEAGIEERVSDSPQSYLEKNLNRIIKGDWNKVNTLNKLIKHLARFVFTLPLLLTSIRSDRAGPWNSIFVAIGLRARIAL